MLYKEINYKHFVRKTPSVDFHLHDGCEIYYLLSGDVQYFVEKQIYDVAVGDVFITNPNEIHKPNFKSDRLYERITLEFDPAFFSGFSTENFDLTACFFNRKNGSGNKITLTGEQHERVRSIFAEIEALKKEGPAFGDIKECSLTIELLIILNEASKRSGTQSTENKLSNDLVEIIKYIDEHLETNLSLSLLEKKFYVSRAHLCRVFKEQTNSTLHQYVVKKRISRAKQLLKTDFNITEAMQRCGFSDSSNFIKTFKKHTGMTPSAYKKLYT